MPNWCINTVTFEGTPSKLKMLENLFESLAEKQRIEDSGQLPDFIKEKREYFFSSRWEEGVLCYETRWSPNTEILIEIADYFEVDFIHQFEECGCLIYGEANYKKKILTVTELESTDFDLFEFDEENENWIFEGQRYENDFEIK